MSPEVKEISRMFEPQKSVINKRTLEEILPKSDIAGSRDRTCDQSLNRRLLYR